MDRSESQVVSGGACQDLLRPDAKCNKALKRWEIKALAQPTLFLDVAMAIAWLLFALFYAYGLFFHECEITRQTNLNAAIVGMVVIFYCWVMGVRQKTFYMYFIAEAGGEVKYWLHYPKYAGVLFKGLAVFALIAILAMISVVPSMIFAIVGIGGVSLAAAVKLWGWENEVDHDYFEWHRIQLVFTDRKRNLVVLQRRYDPNISFEENYMYFEVFLPKGKVDEFLDICKKYAPPHVDYEEGRLKY